MKKGILLIISLLGFCGSAVAYGYTKSLHRTGIKQQMKIYQYYSELFQTDPVSTEYDAYEILKKHPIEKDINYLAIPWAVLINTKKLDQVPQVELNGGFTICQHISYEKIIPILKRIGIDTLFTPHVVKGKVYHGIKVLPFPHCVPHDIEPALYKDLLYSFIGMDNHPIRSKIFNTSAALEKVIMKKRDLWHWDNTPEQQELERMEYQDVLARSRFSLCPRGTGASTIRFWESLQAGAIPVLISDAMTLPEGINWNACIIRVAEKDVANINDIISSIPLEQEQAMRANCLQAYQLFSGDNLVSTIRAYFDSFETVSMDQYKAKNIKEKIKLYSFYTPSHQILVDEWFLPSIQDDYDLIISLYNQECDSGNFMQAGWIKTMLYKVDLIIQGIKENWGNFFIHSDVDIQFFGPTEEIIVDLMQDKDMVIQHDSPRGGACAGFFACRGNDKTLKLWQEIKRRLSDERHMKKNPTTNDQGELNQLIKHHNPYNIEWSYLPISFFGGGLLTGKMWNPGDTLTIPEDIVIHHANWTISLENKIAQLKYVKEVVNQNKS